LPFLVDTFLILTAAPGAKVFASTLDRFYDELLSHVQDAPQMSPEIEDTWFQGIQSDPRRLAEYRSLQKTYSKCITSANCDHTDTQVQNDTRFMMRLTEHTWGIPNVNVYDTIHWTNKEFQKVVKEGNFQISKFLWLEQRAFTNLTLEALETHPLARMMLNKLETTKPKPFPLDGCKELLFSNPTHY